MNAVIESLGWMLLHSLWEGAVVWVLLQLALIALRRRSAQARYLAACGALAATAFWPWMTFGSMDLFARLQSVPAVSGPALETSPAAAAALPAATPALRPAALERPASGRTVVEIVLPWLVGGWALGVLILAGRLGISWCLVRRLARTPLPGLPPAWRRRFEGLCRTAGVRSVVRLGETAAVTVPLVAGWLKPAVLLPLGVLTQLPVAQVEAILLHELAHIRRHDFLVNLLQAVVETLFFYHPAVRSINRRIRIEREQACDDLSVSWCRDPVVYAEALTTFEAYRQRALVLAMTGEKDLVTRVRRVLGLEPRPRVASFFASAAFLALGGYLASMFLAPLLAAELMTDRERVATIEALQPAPDPARSSGPSENVFVTGTLQTEDGRALPPSLFDPHRNLKQSEAKITSSRFGGWLGGGLSMQDAETYYGNTQTGRIEIGVWAQGYAPLRKTITASRGGKVKADLLLRRGFPAKVRITDPSGQPLAGVTLTATAHGGDSRLEISRPPVETDAEGTAVLGQVESDSTIRLNAFKPGWQMADQVLSRWAPGTTATCELEAARPTSGTVLDRATRQPIAGAEIILAARRGSGDSYVTFDPKEAQLLGRSDEKGRFHLDTLTPNSGYAIYARASGYPTQSFPIDYGQQDRVCELSRGLHLKGKILDPKGILASEKYFHPISLQVMFTLQATPFNGHGQSERRTLAKLGPEIPFEFENLPAGPAALVFAISGLEQYRYDLKLEKDVDDYVIDLDAPPPANSRSADDPRPRRPLQIVFQTEADEPLTGSIDVGYLTTNGDQRWVTPETAPIQGNRATVDLPVPTTVDLSADQIAGYWFAPESFELPKGSGAFSRPVKVSRAGVIHGKIGLSAGFRNGALSILPVVVRPPSGRPIQELTSGTFRELSPRGEYVTPPLPLGGTYAVIVNAAPSYFAIDPAVVDATHPIVERNLDLKIPGGALKGRFVDQDRQPIAYQEVILTYHPDEATECASHSATTGEDGSFVIPGVNFAVPGNYEVQLFGDRWEKSAVRIDGRTPQPFTITLQPRTKSAQP